MLIAWNPKKETPEAEKQLIVEALQVVEGALLQLAPTGLLKRDFAAIVVAHTPNGVISMSKRNWETFQNAWDCRCWLGNEASFRQAQRDYLENAFRKSFTCWRTCEDNTHLIMHHAGQLVAEDSLWPGGVADYCLNAGVSGQEPPQDILLANIFTVAHNAISYCEINRDRYVSFYPPAGQDTKGGESFDYPPAFDGFDRIGA